MRACILGSPCRDDLRNENFMAHVGMLKGAKLIKQKLDEVGVLMELFGAFALRRLSPVAALVAHYQAAVARRHRQLWLLPGLGACLQPSPSIGTGGLWCVTSMLRARSRTWSSVRVEHVQNVS